METIREILSLVGDFFVRLGKKIAAFFVMVWTKVATFVMKVVRGFVPFWVGVGKAIADFCVRFVRGFVPFWVGLFHKIKNFRLPKTKAEWVVFWDKVTTGILIFLFASPVLILGYILLWFVLK